MGYQGLVVDNIPVVVSIQGMTNPIARVAQDRRGALKIEIRHTSPWVWVNTSAFTINSPPNQVPSLQVARARAISTNSADDQGTVGVWTDEAVLATRIPAPTEQVRVRWYLSGVNFVELRNQPVAFAVAGRDWTLELLDTDMATRERLRVDGYESITAGLSCGPLPANEIATLEEPVYRIRSLLSFALGGFVGAPRRDVLDHAELTTRLIPRREVRPFSLGPVDIDGPHPGLTKKYLELCYGPLVKAEASFPMTAMIQLLLLARAETVLQVKALLVANFLEVVRFNYANNVLVPAGRATRKKDDFYDATGDKLYFNRLLNGFANDTGLTRWSDKFKDLRNSIVHMAEIPGAALADKIAVTRDALHFCDTCILALLDWDKVSGEYIPSNQPLDPRPNVQGNNVKPFVR